MLYSSGTASGCASVVALPSPAAPLRVLLKVLFAGLSDAQWTAFSAAVYSRSTVTGAQLLCGSTVSFLRADGELTRIMNPVVAPSWLGPGAAGTICSTDVLEGAAGR